MIKHVAETNANVVIKMLTRKIEIHCKARYASSNVIRTQIDIKRIKLFHGLNLSDDTFYLLVLMK